MARKETAAQRKTRIAMLLADYDARSRELRKLAKDVDEMKKQIRADVTPGTYGDFTYATGTPRQILDQPAAREAMTRAGIVIPTTTTEPPIVVTRKP